MYLKSLEMTGFKSFADKTRLEFERGMTAIVGPNGCGKSNISDAIRWVLGEQSPKALRGSQMVDCIFNGTDDRKAVGMAEVAITMADCEEVLGTEYNEVTVGRRVFRSGEGQYFINKTPCRLKDIQRLFMDTGIGTNSYSIMEQGRIDAILSSRPEDRRIIFEEASGITKFKSDKKEAIRKLEHTEANLLRLSDVIREVKRQIGSLQRQAGKARRYKELREELQGLDVYATREKLKGADSEIASLEEKAGRLAEQMHTVRREVRSMEEGASVLHQGLMNTEREIGGILEAATHARSSVEHSREMVRVSEQRIEEQRRWSERDSAEIEKAGNQTAEKKRLLDETRAELESANAEHQEARHALEQSVSELEKHHEKINSVRAGIRELREESVQVESSISKLQNSLVENESRRHSAEIEKERLAAERNQLSREISRYSELESRMARETQVLRSSSEEAASEFRAIEEELAKLDTLAVELAGKRAEAQSEEAALNAEIRMLSGTLSSADNLPEGASRLLSEDNTLCLEPEGVLGPLSKLVSIEKGYRTAFEAAMRAWLDCVVVKDMPYAIRALAKIAEEGSGAARLLAASVSSAKPASESASGDRLLDHLEYSEALSDLMDSLLGNVMVISDSSHVPHPLPPEWTGVTKDGLFISGSGVAERWEPDASNAFSIENMLDQTRTRLKEVGDRLSRYAAEASRMEAQRQNLIGQRRDISTKAERTRSDLARKEGETQVIAGEAGEMRKRLETVSWELESMVENSGEAASESQTMQSIEALGETRDSLAKQIAAQTEELHEIESEFSGLQSQVTEKRVRVAEIANRLSNLESKRSETESVVKDLEDSIASRRAGMAAYDESIKTLFEEIAAEKSKIESLERGARESEQRAEDLKKNREKQAQELEAMEKALAAKRQALDDLTAEKNELDVHCAENRLRRQNTLDKTTSEYGLSLEDILTSQDPEWSDDGAPSMDAVETQVAELRTKIEAMGPVNLVAIEEYNELEERYAFLTRQEEDLVKSKQQLLDMIRTINKTTSEMFRSTFDKVNENFQDMFKKFFNGGSAKLVLVNEEDVLECGIEIIARPPGKKLQNVSLLSGGERTLTAVALLFAIYMVKPSPFCLLDELDAALDESNINRFVSVLELFLNQSQFVVITHSRQTIAASDTIYGVTMRDKGVSSMVSVKLTDNERKPAEAKA